MGFGLFALKVHEPGRRFNQSLHLRVFAVQEAQRVQVQAALRLGVKLVGMGFKVGDQGGAVLFALLGLAQAIHLQLDACDAQLFP